MTGDTDTVHGRTAFGKYSSDTRVGDDAERGDFVPNCSIALMGGKDPLARTKVNFKHVEKTTDVMVFPRL